MTQVHVRNKVLLTAVGVGPAGILKERLAAKLLGDSQSFERAQATNPLAPVSVLRLASGLPVALDELANAARRHASILVNNWHEELKFADSECFAPS